MEVRGVVPRIAEQRRSGIPRVTIRITAGSLPHKANKGPLFDAGMWIFPDPPKRDSRSTVLQKLIMNR